MARNLESPRLEAAPNRHPFYPEDICPRMQSLLAVLADFDYAHEKNLDTIRNSAADEAEKRDMLEMLTKQHQERRVPYVRELEALQRRIHALFH